MQLFVVIGLDDRPGSIQKRNENRPAHGAYVRANDAPIRLVGPMFDDDGEINGSLYIFEAGSADEIRAWLEPEPFHRAGVYRELIIRPFEVRRNQLPLRELAAVVPART
jgi:uncharacterized protein YciI